MSSLLSDPYVISVLIFALLLAIYVYRDRKKFERQSIVLLRRTTRGRNAIIKIAERFPRFWKHLGTTGIGIGFAASVFVFYTLIENLVKAATTEQKAGLAFLLPSPTATAVAGPGFLAVPFWYWIIAIGMLVVVHEGLHGVMTVIGKVKIKSLGWGLLAVIPLAFVEPDEKALQKKNFMTQQRVFAAGSLANFILAGIALLVVSYGFLWAYGEEGVGFHAFAKGQPAEQANLTGVITSIDGQMGESRLALGQQLEKISPGQEITITTKLVENNKVIEKSYQLKTVAEPNSTSNKAYIGILGVRDAKLMKEDLLPFSGPITFFEGLFFFLFLINLGVGLANMLPLKPLDGGRMWELVFQKVSKKHSKTLTHGIAWITFILIIANFVIPQVI